MDISIAPNQDGGADMSVGGSTDTGFRGSATVHLPSGNIGSASVGVSGDSGHMDIRHDCDRDRSIVNVGNGDNTVRGSVGYDWNSNQPSVGISANLNY